MRWTCQCYDNCTYCIGGHKKVSGPIFREPLVRVFQASIFTCGPVPAYKFIGYLSNKIYTVWLKKAIFEVTNKNTILSDKVHGVFLMIVAYGMLSLEVRDESHISFGQLNIKNLIDIIAKESVTDNNELSYNRRSI